MSLLAVSDLTAVRRQQLGWDVSPDEAGPNFLHVSAIPLWQVTRLFDVAELPPVPYRVDKLFETTLRSTWYLLA
jgi:hypothetical protein